MTDRDHTHIRVVAVSPGDVQGERDVLAGVVDELDDGIAAELGLRLSLWRWETDARPGLHLLGPQGLIDEHMQIEDADLVVGVFWKRFGTPTHDAGSGTEHELRRAWDSWRERERPEVMVYFCQRPYTPMAPDEARQWAAVLEFQEQLPEEQLWWRYDAVADFERLARSHLTAYLRRRPRIEPGPRTGRRRLRFNVPHALAHFVGRDAELDALDQALGVAEQVVVTQAITGLGGVGKSQLAARYVQQCADGYDVVAWIGAQDGGVADLAALAGELGEAVEGMAPQERADRALHWLNHADERWLLVLDNLASPDQLPACCPHSGNGRVLITTRHQGMAQFAPLLAVEVFDEDTATDYLVRRAGRPGDGAAARRLARALGLLPLALSHAGAYCVAGTSFTEYLGLLSELPTQALFKASPEIFYEQTVASTWQTSIAAADDDAPLASAALQMAAHLAPDDIPRGLFSILVDAADPAERMAVSDALNALHRFSLLTIHDDSVHMHRLLAQTVRDRSTAEAREQGWFAALAALQDAWSAAGDVARPESWRHHEPLLAHVLAIADTAPASDAELVGLLIGAGAYLVHARGGARAIAVNRAAQSHAERALGPDDRDALTARSNLAASYWSAGRTTEALELLERVLDDYERILGPEHRDTLTARSNLATSYWSAGRTSEALALDERALAECERILGPEHRDTLIARANLAASYASAGRTDDALTLRERVLAEYERVLGPEHPQTLASRNNLATSYSSAGRTNDALKLRERVLAERERILGAEHPDTLMAGNNLAASYSAAGRTGDAFELLEQVLVACERILGSEHPDTLTARANLAASYSAAGRTDDALTLRERVLAERERVLGPLHPQTLIARNNLATSYSSTGRTDDALGLLEQVLAEFERVLGAEHPDTLMAGNNLAACYASAGRKDDALKLLRHVLAVCERVRGPEHPDTLVARANLAAGRSGVSDHDPKSPASS